MSIDLLTVQFGNWHTRLPFLHAYIDSWNKELHTKPISYVFRIILTDIEMNHFLTTSDKQLARQWLAESQRRIYLQTHFGFKWLYLVRRRRDYLNTNDLRLSPIVRDGPGNIYIFSYREAKFYVFTQKDMLKLIHMNLDHAEPYTPRPNPLPLKNPYTNIPFNREELRVIDRQLQYKPLVWRLFKESNYCVKEMLRNHSRYLNIQCMDDYVHHMDTEDWWYYLDDAFDLFGIRQVCRTCINEAIANHNRRYQNTMIKWLNHTYLDMYGNGMPLLFEFKAVYQKKCDVHSKPIVVPPQQNQGFQLGAEIATFSSDSFQGVFVFNGNGSTDVVVETASNDSSETDSIS